jgi:monooxygenase
MSPTSSDKPEHFDVLIVGAGLSGIGAACHLRSECPGKSFAILEARAAMGGTWDLFRYPGVRSDSDMFTLGYRFHPWKEAKAIADGPSIRSYIEETAARYGVDRAVRYERRAVHADWSWEDARWTVDVVRTDTGEREQYSCNFLYLNAGYYRYDEGYTPVFDGTERFRGQIVHPQHWPGDLDYAGKRVVVIGSGATAVTLVPAMSDEAAHVTMLQRSPTYVTTLPALDPIADFLRKRLPARAVYPIVRWKNVLLALAFYQLCQRAPGLMKKLLRKGVESHLPDGYDVDTHFTPRYDPWDQRLCFVPDADLFDAIKAGKVDIVTDTIDTFTETGIALRSGSVLEADVIVTATGLNLQVMGGMTLTIDAREVDVAETVGYKGIMFTGIPNLASTFGYTNASWTLKADLGADYVCRLLRHMDAHGYRTCVPRAPDPTLPTEPFLELTSGYVLRSLDRLPRQGSKTPWRLHQNYLLDLRLMRHGRIDDGALEFSAGGAVRQLEQVAG